MCHQLAGRGQKIGPQLDGIAKRGLERIIEDVLDPNRNVDPSFRTLNLVLKNGQALTGLPRRQEGATLVLADPQGKEFRVATADIDEQARSRLSLMPSNFAETIPPDQLQHLLAYLLESGQPNTPPSPGAGR